MAIGAIDYIDQLLVKKYSKEQADNHDNKASNVSPEKMMADMNEFSSNSKNFFILNQQLSAACSAINSLNAQYRAVAAY